MKSIYKNAALVICLLAVTICSHAQGDKVSPTPTKFEDHALSWKEVSSAEGGFSASFPKPPQQSSELVDLAPGVQIKLFVHNLKTSAEYSVVYADYPIRADSPDIAKIILDAGAKGAVSSIKSELLEIKEIELDGNPGRYLKERLRSGQVMRVKMFLVGQRLYQIAITTPVETDASEADIKLYGEVSEKFLGSFKLTK